MTPGRPFRSASFLIVAALIAVIIGAKPLYAVDAGSENGKKTDQQKKIAKDKKEIKPRNTAAPPVENRYPSDNAVPGSGY
jgi:hypothetical protein